MLPGRTAGLGSTAGPLGTAARPLGTAAGPLDTTAGPLYTLAGRVCRTAEPLDPTAGHHKLQSPCPVAKTATYALLLL